MNRLQIPENDRFNVFVPIEDNELIKSLEVDENGDYIIQGLMTSDAQDEENDSIDPHGADCSYFLEKGWIKYEHGNNPEQFIGEPLEVKVGRFTHPTLLKPVNGIFIKGRLFANRKLTREAVNTIQDLQKSNTKRRMGLSIEGSVRERCKKTGKILKSVIRNVVLTMNPVNTTTWVELAKSFAKNHEVTVACDLDKSMDLANTEAIRTQSLEGADKPKKDKNKKYLEVFRKYLAMLGMDKLLNKSFITSSRDEIEMGAFNFGVVNGLDYEEADKFASYIAERHEILKSLIGKIAGGVNMPKADLASLLDTDLEELKKSIEAEELQEDLEELLKSMDDNQDDDEEYEDEEESSEDDESGEDTEDDEDGDEEDEEDTEKSLKSDFAKSFASKDEETAQALEVSEFLKSLTDEIGYTMDGFGKSIQLTVKNQNTMLKALNNTLEVVKSLASEVQNLRSENEELSKSLSEILSRPVGRKSVVNQREVQTLTKGMNAQGKPMSRMQISEALYKSFEKGEISGSVITRFEADGYLPAEVRAKIGLA